RTALPSFPTRRSSDLRNLEPFLEEFGSPVGDARRGRNAAGIPSIFHVKLCAGIFQEPLRGFRAREGLFQAFPGDPARTLGREMLDRKSTRLNSSHVKI